MRNIPVLFSFLAFILIVAGCQSGDVIGPSATDAFIGGTTALRLAFIENSPPGEVTDMQKDANGILISTSGFDFDASVTIENIGETDIPANGLEVEMSGFFPGDFGITDTENLKQTHPGTGEKFLGVSKDPDGNKIQGDITQLTFPSTDKFKYNKALAGSQQFPFRAEVCYPYQTKVLSQVCLMKDFTNTEQPVCDPSRSRSVSNSGAPIHITSISQSVGGKNKFLLNFNVRKVGSSDLFKPTTQKCLDEFTHKERVQVTVNTGLAGLKCLGLIGGSQASDQKSYSGEVWLVDDSASFTCVQTLTTSDQVDSIKTFDVKLSYYARDSITTTVLVKHLI